VDLFVSSSAESLCALLEHIVVFSRANADFGHDVILRILNVLLDLLLNLLEFSLGKREVVVFPLPLKVTLAVVVLVVESATGADLFIDNSHRLKSVR
jgi:hypothetical protein